jgi:sarcosine oxidase/L-pipecolate oxidase
MKLYALRNSKSPAFKKYKSTGPIYATRRSKFELAPSVWNSHLILERESMPNRSVLIIGGGAFGTSTAYHLSDRGYNKITVLDRFPAPSKDAAATDLNKTVRYDYPSLVYSELAQEAMAAWKSSSHPLSGLFNQTGWIMAAGELARNFIDATYRASRLPSTQYISPKDIKMRWPELYGSFSGWFSIWSPEAGWVETPWLLRRQQKTSC